MPVYVRWCRAAELLFPLPVRDPPVLREIHIQARPPRSGPGVRAAACIYRFLRAARREREHTFSTFSPLIPLSLIRLRGV